jgi:hypothetical protein
MSTRAKYTVVVEGVAEVEVRIADHSEAFNAARAVGTALAKIYPGRQVSVIDAGTGRSRCSLVGEPAKTVRVRRKRLPR